MTRSCPAKNYKRGNYSMGTLLGMLMAVLLTLAGCGDAELSRKQIE